MIGYSCIRKLQKDIVLLCCRERLFFKQYAYCLLVGILSTTLEKVCRADQVNSFIFENGLLTILAMLSINVGTGCHVISCLVAIEQEYSRPFHFDFTKKTILYGFYEQFLMIFIFYFTLVVTPESWWSDTSVFSAATCFAAVLRACLFQAAYCTLDYAKTVINSSMNPCENINIDD